MDKGFFKTFIIIYSGMFIGQIFFLLLTVFIHLQNENQNHINENITGIFRYIIPVVLLTGIFGGNYLSKQRLTAIVKTDSIQRKIENYKILLITKWALIEAPTFLAIVAFFVTGEYLFVYMALISFAYFLSLAPRKEKIISILNISHDEAKEMNLR